MSAPTVVSSASRVRLHHLHLREDDGSWIVGRVETGDFIAIPPVGRRALTLLPDHTVAEVQTRLHDETGDEVDVVDFVSSLVEIGFVAEVDGTDVNSGPVPRSMLARLRPEHVRWLLHPAAALACALVVLVALAALAFDPGLVPEPHDLLWSELGFAVLLGNLAIVWTLILLHELAHLFVARAAGAPGRMSLGTRLQFLAAQTDVSGVWAAPRRARFSVYLAGIVANLVVAAIAVLVRAAGVAGRPGEVLAAVALLSVSLIPAQFLVFMRTDLYFVLQDAAGCANLYADGSAYARYLAGRVVRRRTAADDPSRRLSGRERTAVRWYTVVLVVGTIVCLAVEILVTLPVAIALFTSAVDTALTGGTSTQLLDAGAVAVTTVLFFVLWTRAWWRTHGSQVRRGMSRLRGSGIGGR
ncbi:M50 family metallopeptidase [Cryptosporangium japonicum]|uniref:Peptide zinc metalloprotease protein n=1 Tax=Cryptosporangium japonicum TaxID=80872 RepID=A0ABN0V5T6_9ACTN